MFHTQKWKLSIIGFFISVLVLALIICIVPLIVYQTQQIVLSPDPTFNDDIDVIALEQTRQILDERLQDLDQPFWSSFTGDRVTVRGENIVVSIPRTALHANVIQDLTASSEMALIETGIEFPTMDGVRRVKTSLEANPTEGIYQVLLTPDDFIQATLLEDKADFGIEIQVSQSGIDRLRHFLDNQRGVYLCLTKNDVVVGCPVIKLLDNNLVQIWQGPTGFLIDDEALMDHINTGFLPIPLIAAKIP